MLTVQKRIQAIKQEMADTHFERSEIIGSLWVAAISFQHLIIIGPGGTGKSQICRDFGTRILGGQYYETQLSEGTTPDMILGPTSIKGLVENDLVRRHTKNMLPEATHALIDEFFNGNLVLLHDIMDVLNERVLHNGDEVISLPLRNAIMGTNKLNADVELAALWDRVHLRHQVDFVRDRDNMQALLNAAVLRKVSHYVRPQFTTVTLDEIDKAHDEAMLLPVPEVTMTAYLDLIEELTREQGIEISTRRQVEGLAAVLANAWINGHSEVSVGDISIVRHMFWSRQEDAAIVRNTVLAACNPGEKRALELLVDLDGLKTDYNTALGLDSTKMHMGAVEVFRRAQMLVDEGFQLRDGALAAGASTGRIDDMINAAKALRVKISEETFGTPLAEVERTMASASASRR